MIKKLVLMLALSTLLSFAGESGNAPIQESMRVNLVELQVKAVDLNQKFIHGLTADDFVVRENGKTQTIDSIEKIDVGTMDYNRSQENRARIMILLDYKNTHYTSMFNVWRQLNKFVDMDYDGRDEIGLAANTIYGIDVLVPFTNDHEKFKEGLAKAKQRFRGTNHYIDRPDELGFSRAGFNNDGPSVGMGRADYEWSDAYYRTEMNVLNQFVNYLGSWSGRKDLILVSGLWMVPDNSDTEGNTDSDGIASIKDLQTTSIYNKVAINVVGIYRNIGRTERANIDINAARTSERSVLLSSSTGGLYLRGNSQMVAKLVNKAVNHSQQYYLIRYYSTNQGDKFRRVKVRAKGITAVAQVSGGYFPKTKQVPIQAARVPMTDDRTTSFKMSLNTDWMTWQRVGFRKRGAFYAVSQVAYDELGRILGEQVVTGRLSAKKEKGGYPPVLLQRHLNLELPSGTVPARMETVITDLTSGKKMTLQHRGVGDLI